MWCKACQHQVEPDHAEMAARYGADTSVLAAKGMDIARCFGQRLAHASATSDGERDVQIFVTERPVLTSVVAARRIDHPPHPVSAKQVAALAPIAADLWHLAGDRQRLEKSSPSLRIAEYRCRRRLKEKFAPYIPFRFGVAEARENASYLHCDILLTLRVSAIHGGLET